MKVVIRLLGGGGTNGENLCFGVESQSKMDAKEANVGIYFTKLNKKRLPDAFEVVFNHIWLLSFPNCIPVKYIYTKLERFYFHRDCQICPQSPRPVT